MFGSDVLEVGIGVTLLFLFVSLIATAIRELIETRLKTRASDLEKGIIELLRNKSGEDGGPASGLVAAFYEHPLIYSLYGGGYETAQKGQLTLKERFLGVNGGKLPSYIPAKSFSLALLDIVARGRASGAGSDGQDSLSINGVRAAIQTIENPCVQRAVLAALDASQGSLDQARANLEAWYDGTMDRVSGWYKRRTQWIVFAIGLALAILMNSDALTVARVLFAESGLRKGLVAQAGTYTAATADPTKVVADPKALRAELERLNFPIGWQGELPQSRVGAFRREGPWRALHALDALVMLIGWLITAAAVTLGAPFWFDLLNKFMVIRSTVKPREKSQEEGSEDKASTT